MSKVYLLSDNASAQSLTRLRCKDEDKELQCLLQHNPSLLPSEQIDRADPPHWLLVKREMPVANPASGTEWWSVDFLYVDHRAIPTLVECKRCDDTRSRREVIAQMLEYAANGHHYWVAADLQAYAEQAAGGAEQLDAWIACYCEAGATAAAFFEAVIANLRESRMRLVFFLEESPNELRSLVDFLNRQLKQTEVLLVEARLYECAVGRIVVPWLFGYTEEARVAKRESRAQLARPAGASSEEAFRTAFAENALAPEARSVVRALLDAWPCTTGDEPGWNFRINAIFMHPSMMKTRGLFHLARNGDLQLYFGAWSGGASGPVTPEQAHFKERFAEEVSRLCKFPFTKQQLCSYPTIKAAQFVPKVPEFIAALRRVVSQSVQPQDEVLSSF